MINSRQNLLSYLIKNVASVGLTTKVHGVRILGATTCVLVLTASKFMMVCPVSRYTESRKRTLVNVVGYTEKEKSL